MFSHNAGKQFGNPRVAPIRSDESIASNIGDLSDFQISQSNAPISVLRSIEETSVDGCCFVEYCPFHHGAAQENRVEVDALDGNERSAWFYRQMRVDVKLRKFPDPSCNLNSGYSLRNRSDVVCHSKQFEKIPALRVDAIAADLLTRELGFIAKENADPSPGEHRSTRRPCRPAPIITTSKCEFSSRIIDRIFRKREQR